MEHLTKQQIILLTLFTTFVTSIATGIVTVSLMDQAPVGFTSTIEHVIDHTVDQDSNSADNDQSASAVNALASTNTSAPVDTIADATALVEKSLVKIELVSNTNGDVAATNGSKITGLGVVVSKTGLVVADKSAIAMLGNYVAVFPGGQSFPVQILQSQNNGDIVFLLVEVPIASTTSITFVPAKFASLTGPSAPRLGQTALAISGVDTMTIEQGIIKEIHTDASSSPLSYVTTINPSETLIGSPLFDVSGEVVGIKTQSLSTISSLSDLYYPISILKPVIPILTPVPTASSQ